MHLHELKLTHFKNYEYQAVEFSPRLNLITGLNGMGKTNLLDAIYYLCMCKSHFPITDRHALQQGADFFRLEGHFFIEKKEEKIVAKVVPGKLKSIECNDTAYPRISDHVGLLPIVFMAPDDTVLALEGSEERRRFLDNTLCQLDRTYLEALVKHNRILEKRNALLRQTHGLSQLNRVLLDAYNQQLLPTTTYIFEKRQAFLTEFQPVFNRFYQAISEGTEIVDCCYRSQITGGNFLHLLENSLEKDLHLQRTTAGIHRDDLVFQLKKMPLKRFASQGQLKSFVLSLKLAQYECLRTAKEKTPILLLDDLFDKLDDQRVGQLLEMLVSNDFSQVFITDTHPARSEQLAQRFGGEYRKFGVENGVVRPIGRPAI